MSFEVKIMPQAELDLRGIYEYIAYTLQSPMNARGQLKRLEKQILKLSTFPTGYPAYSKEPWKTRGLRCITIDNYIAYFIPHEETEIISILRVMYRGRNVEEQLDKHTDY